MGGGSGLKYAASTIIYLSKKKEKDGTEVIGNLHVVYPMELEDLRSIPYQKFEINN